MCRLFALISPEPVAAAPWLLEAPRALLCQSRRDAQGREHADGWGIAWYAARDPVPAPPASRHACRPAHDDPAYAPSARQAVGHIVLAHVRKASVGTARLANCHPFIVGTWAFAHNGTIPHFEGIEPLLVEELSSEYRAARQGETDSECLFLWLLHGWQGAASASIDPQRCPSFLSRSLRRLEAKCPPHARDQLTLTFVATDGRHLTAVRWNNCLYWARAEEAAQGWLAGHRSTGPALLVASEPLSQHGWQELPERSMLTVDAALHVRQCGL
jgi:glutamine amidotransferase